MRKKRVGRNQFTPRATHNALLKPYPEKLFKNLPCETAPAIQTAPVQNTGLKPETAEDLPKRTFTQIHLAAVLLLFVVFIPLAAYYTSSLTGLVAYDNTVQESIAQTFSANQTVQFFLADPPTSFTLSGNTTGRVQIFLDSNSSSWLVYNAS